ncbi:hypothetical protein JG688_00003339 [Phytophthora aleatoria]|uniref:Uncharacterized protein n=1 Tax=Phytophthora aleatoria TaxID=2496075 RepID=A0A8J5MA45_9STRA|nr:hypothetical protein JG688_00003339 [Phytophthora aleatoria]
MQAYMILSSASSHRLVNEAREKVLNKFSTSCVLGIAQWTVSTATLCLFRAQLYDVGLSRLPKSDPRYGNLEAYTLHFAEHEGGAALLEKVKKLFAGNDPNGALEAASKA